MKVVLVYQKASKIMSEGYVQDVFALKNAFLWIGALKIWEMLKDVDEEIKSIISYLESFGDLTATSGASNCLEV